MLFLRFIEHLAFGVKNLAFRREKGRVSYMPDYRQAPDTPGGNSGSMLSCPRQIRLGRKA